MDMYNVSEYGHADAYLIQSTNSNSHLISPLLEPFETMYKEGAREFVVDQGLYYPSAANYGYICTGLESPSDWYDHHRVFGVDGQDIQFMGAQTESLPYVYYTPSYGYSQSPYNPYNPYIPGAMIGVDGSYMGAQQYYIPAYENVTTSSPSYIPMVVQTGPEIHSNSMTDPYIHTAGSTANRVDVSGLKRNFSPASATFTLNPVRSASNQTNPFTSSEGLKGNGGPSKLSMAHGAVPSNSFTSARGRDAQVMDNVSHGKALSNRNQLKVALPSGNGLSNFGSGGNGRVHVDKVRPKSSLDKIASDDNGNPDPLIEQNRGPKINKSKSHLIVKSYTTRAGNCDAQGNITIYIDQYNKDDFPIEYENAKFFVIKSYSEDDVHKSIKYNVWSSTPNGNKKLNSAYEDSQRIASADPKGCPIFLFFSVNASGQFCGVAEMTGQVDFHRDMDFWQQDKWSGSFPVKWHIVKDVPNPSFRHIILENNEHKPVTNSRDTQEIRYRKGLEMLKVFKNHVSKTSLLDDFLYYENRQKMLQEEKTRLLMKSYGTPLFVPVLDPPRKLHSFFNLPPGEDEQITKHSNLHSPDTSVVTPSKQTTIDTSVGNPSTQSKQTTSDANAGNPGSTQVEQSVNGKATEGDILKIGSLTIIPKQAEPVGASASGVTTAKSGSDGVVTVGSMPVKVNGFAEPSVVLTVGTIPLNPRALRVEEGVSKNFTKTGSKET